MADMKPDSDTRAAGHADAELPRPSLVGAWALAARPKTLPAAASPLIVAIALAYNDVQAAGGGFRWVPAICCLAFALIMQIAANFVNDYADYKKGADTEARKGPRRAVANGWITPRAMLIGTIVTLGIACLVGLATLPYGGYKLIPVGAICCVFCVLYSAGPLPLAYIGLGDVLVVVFFGIVPISFTYFLQLGSISADAVLTGLAIGFAVDNILVSNNYRDRDEDRANRKFTLIAIFGERFGRYFYLVNGLIAIGLLAFVFMRRQEWTAVGVGALVVYLALHLQTWRTLSRIREGKALIRVLALSARNLLILSVILAVSYVAYTVHVNY